MTVEIDNREKIFFPDSRLSKGDLADYYRQIAGVMLPHVKDRPLTVNRFPDGIDGVNFIQKSVQAHYPDRIKSVTVEKEDGDMVQPVVDSGDALVYLAGQGAIAFHVTLSKYDTPAYPDRLIFDLDPSDDGANFAPVVAAARAVRDALADIDLASWVMTSGSAGLHVTVPLNQASDFQTVRALANGIAAVVAAAYPDDFTTEQSKDKRAGRLYIDIQRNAYNQTAIAPYSVRPKPGAPIAAPLDWDELGARDLTARRWHIGNIFRRLAQRDCPWADIARHGQDAAAALARLRD